MVWPFLMGGAAVLTVTSILVGSGHSLRASGAMLCGFVVARIIMNFPISGEYLDVMFSAMWVTVALSMPIGPSSEMFPSVVAKVAVFGCALCSLWGRLVDADMYFGSPPYMAADTLLIVAMILIGWTLRHDVVDRISELSTRERDLVGNHTVYLGGPLDNSKAVQSSSKSEARPASKVRAHG